MTKNPRLEERKRRLLTPRNILIVGGIAAYGVAVALGWKPKLGRVCPKCGNDVEEGAYGCKPGWCVEHGDYSEGGA